MIAIRRVRVFGIGIALLLSFGAAPSAAEPEGEERDEASPFEKLLERYKLLDGEAVRVGLAYTRNVMDYREAVFKREARALENFRSVFIDAPDPVEVKLDVTDILLRGMFDTLSEMFIHHVGLANVTSVMVGAFGETRAEEDRQGSARERYELVKWLNEKQTLFVENATAGAFTEDVQHEVLKSLGRLARQDRRFEEKKLEAELDRLRAFSETGKQDLPEVVELEAPLYVSYLEAMMKTRRSTRGFVHVEFHKRTLMPHFKRAQKVEIDAPHGKRIAARLNDISGPLSAAWKKRCEQDASDGGATGRRPEHRGLRALPKSAGCERSVVLDLAVHVFIEFSGDTDPRAAMIYPNGKLLHGSNPETERYMKELWQAMQRNRKAYAQFDI